MSERLWAPWRIGFLRSEKPPGCFLCDHPRQSKDVENLILHRGERCFVCLNAYPYTAGHLLVAPYRHVGQLPLLELPELHEVMETVQRWVGVVERVYRCEGFNVGINQGKAAGAAIGDHLHVHIVPRWLGDVNFISAVSGIGVIHQSLEEAYTMLREASL